MAGAISDNHEYIVVQDHKKYKRIFRILDLVDNGLQVLLVHDPPHVPANNNHNHDNTNIPIPIKKAAAAMCVGVGSYSDPAEVQGLAHFLEHMLFLGTEEFPEENEFRTYLKKHGGSVNAHTYIEHTNYYFDVKQEFLKDALRRFSQFFISPLLRSEAMEREVLSIDSEFNLRLQEDCDRLKQLQWHTSICGSPLNKFLLGNKRSLDEATEKGINLREQMLKFYKDYYHGGLMNLVVISEESLDVMMSWVVEYFSAVKEGPQGSLKFNVEGPIWKSGKIYRLEAVKDEHTLELTWELPCIRNKYSMKPDHYLALLLRQSGKGSLLCFLVDLGWVVSFYPGVDCKETYRSSIAYFFTLSIHLTDSGVEKIFDIIGFVYQYLKLLRQASLPKWIFEKLHSAADMRFESKPHLTQVEIAENLQFYPRKLALYGGYVYRTWNEQLIKDILGYLIPNNMRVDFVSRSFPKSTDCQFEPWFGSHYVEEDIAQNLLELWTDPPEINTSLHLLTPDEFLIPNDFLSLWTDDEFVIDFANSSTPRCVVDEPLMKLWNKVDSTFRDLQAQAYFLIHLNNGYDNAKDFGMASLFGFLLQEELSARMHQISKFNHLYNSGWPTAAFVDGKIELKVYFTEKGFEDQLSDVLSVGQFFLPFGDQFEDVKGKWKRTLEKSMMDPTDHCSYLRKHVLTRNVIDIEQHLLNDLSLNDLMEFVPSLVSQIYIEGLYLGNLSEEEATSLTDIFKQYFHDNPLSIELKSVNPVVCLPYKANLVRDASVKNKSEKNSLVEIYFQIEQDTGMESIKLKALIDLFHQIVEVPFFDKLRTKEQLGYKTECGPLIISCVSGFFFRIVSSRYNPVYLQGRIDNFINGLEKLLDDLDSDSFEHYKDGLTAELLPVYTPHKDADCWLWKQIVDKRYIFDEPKKKAEELKNISKQDVVKWYKTYLKRSSQKCRRLITRIWGCNTDMKDAEAVPRSEEEVIITDVAAMKEYCSWYPNHHRTG